jgi:hypothetical protein|nr:MAG TPA: hypothetical protein [Caudoviricetes sp.]
MYILDKEHYCWTTDDSCGEPQTTIKDAIENFYEDDCQNLDCPTVLIGHPSYYIPDMFNAEQLMWDMNDKIEEDYDIALNDELTVDQDQELEERLQQTLYQFLKEHKLDKRIWTVFESMEYKPEDFGIDLSDF